MIEINLFWIFVVILLVVIVFMLFAGHKNLLDNKKDIHFKDKDVSITASLIEKFPLVAPGFIAKSTKEQNIENNQEIHEINKKIEAIEEAVRVYAKIINEMKQKS